MSKQLFLSSLLFASINNNLQSIDDNFSHNQFSENCVFCKIIQGIIPSKKIYETEDVLVIQDISPKASIHYLIIPKRHIPNIQSCTEPDVQLLGTLLLTAQKLSAQLSGNPEFKLISNNGASVGQTVFHIHIHFLSGDGNLIDQLLV